MVACEETLIFLHHWQIVYLVNCEKCKWYTSQTSISLLAGVLSYVFLAYCNSAFISPAVLQQSGPYSTPTLFYINEIVLLSSPVADKLPTYEFTLLGCIGAASHLRNSSYSNGAIWSSNKNTMIWKQFSRRRVVPCNGKWNAPRYFTSVVRKSRDANTKMESGIETIV